MPKIIATAAVQINKLSESRRKLFSHPLATQSTKENYIYTPYEACNIKQ
jgi:hypothetical protein